MMWERVKYVLNLDVGKRTRVEAAVCGILLYLFNLVVALGVVIVLAAVFERGGFVEYLTGAGQPVLWLVSVFCGILAYETAAGTERDKSKWVSRNAIFTGVASCGVFAFLTLLVDYSGLPAATIGGNIVLVLTGGAAGTAVYAFLQWLCGSGEDRGNHEPKRV